MDIFLIETYVEPFNEPRTTKNTVTADLASATGFYYLDSVNTSEIFSLPDLVKMCVSLPWTENSDG